MGAYSGHPAKWIRLLLLVLGMLIVVAACAGNDARPAATSSITPSPTSGSTGTPTSSARSRDEVARLFDYDRRRRWPRPS
jgi:ABC-type glycerol-3-phosphate transport system substrate-binding protein